jgi:hypothetical protein
MMMKPSLPPLAKFLAIGVAGAAILAGFGLLLNRGSQVRLEGSVLKVRTIATDDNASIAVVDFRVSNPAKALFMVSELKLEVTTADGRRLEGMTVAQMDLDRVLEYNKLAGPRFNETLKERDRLRGGTTEDRTAAASFEISEKQLQARSRLVLKIRDADGVLVEIAGN